MDLNTLRSVVALVALITFVVILVWVYKIKRPSDFEEAAQLPFKQD